MRVRSETIADYHRIAEINALAFAPSPEGSLASTFVPEFLLVDALRHRESFATELSLVAEVDGVVVGHALFTPYRAYIAGKEIDAVSLAPIAIAPAYQRKGIGGQLIVEGHRRARTMGYAYSFLLGHPTYYPRFGYLTSMFGQCYLEVSVADIPENRGELVERLVHPDDTGWLARTWLDWFTDVDLAIYPGESILDWSSHVAEIMSLVIEQDGESIGYLRYDKRDPATPKLFLARSRTAVPLLLAHLAAKLADGAEQWIRLPLHPRSEAVKTSFGLPFKPIINPWPAAMIKILDEGNLAVTQYCQQVGSGRRMPGLIIWPPAIEFA